MDSDEKAIGSATEMNVMTARVRAAIVTLAAVIAFGLMAGSGLLDANRASAQEAAS